MVEEGSENNLNEMGVNWIYHGDGLGWYSMVEGREIPFPKLGPRSLLSALTGRPPSDVI